MSKIASLFQKRNQENKQSLSDSLSSCSTDSSLSSKSNIKLSSSEFIVTSKLGTGGFGSVWSGIHERTGEWYAIKEIRKKKIVQNDVAFNMLKNELKILTKINNNNPYIIEFYSLFQDDNCCFFLLNLNLGNDLRFYLKKKFLFTEESLTFIIGCIASALHYLHSCGIMHRDIKPENILINEKGWPYLTDFGVSYLEEKYPQKKFRCNLVSGTRQYLAPEVFLSDHIHGVESDYWSLGILMYELLYGRRPYDKHCPLAMIQFVDKCYKKKNESKEFEASEDSIKMGKKSGLLSPPQSPSLSSNTTPLISPSSSPISSRDFSGKKILFPTINTESNETATTCFSDSSSLKSMDEMDSIKLPKISNFNPSKSISLSSTLNSSPLSLKECLNSNLTGTEDYWNVDVSYDFIMDNNLFIPLPMANPWLGDISTDCLDLLQGLLDIRPHCRLGGRNFLTLRNLEIFKKFNFINWEVDLNPLESSYKPQVKPSKKTIEEMLLKIKDSSRAFFLNEYSDSLSDMDEDADENVIIKYHELKELNYVSENMILEPSV